MAVPGERGFQVSLQTLELQMQTHWAQQNADITHASVPSNAQQRVLESNEKFFAQINPSLGVLGTGMGIDRGSLDLTTWHGGEGLESSQEDHLQAK